MTGPAHVRTPYVSCRRSADCWSSDENGRLTFHDIENGTVRTVGEHGSRGSIFSGFVIAVSNDGRLAATLNPGLVKIWDIATGQMLRSVKVGELGDEGTLAFDSAARTLTVAAKGKLHRIDVMSGDVREIDSRGDVNSVANSPAREFLPAKRTRQTAIADFALDEKLATVHIGVSESKSLRLSLTSGEVTGTPVSEPVSLNTADADHAGGAD